MNTSKHAEIAEKCKQHKNLTIIERVFVEKAYEFAVGESFEDRNDWHSDPIMWHGPKLASITVTCFDCGFEQIYGPSAELPKWVQSAWAVIKG